MNLIDYRESESHYMAFLRSGLYYAAAGLIMDLMSSLLNRHSAVDLERGGQLYKDGGQIRSMLIWLLRDPDGLLVERWLMALSGDPLSTDVHAEIVTHVREDYKRLIGFKAD